MDGQAVLKDEVLNADLGLVAQKKLLHIVSHNGETGSVATASCKVMGLRYVMQSNDTMCMTHETWHCSDASNHDIVVLMF
jgi:signal transduction protein with GAF and PtsI domain